MTKKPIKFTEDMVGNMVGKTAPIGGWYEIVKVTKKPKRKAHRCRYVKCSICYWSPPNTKCGEPICSVCGKQKPERVRR